MKAYFKDLSELILRRLDGTNNKFRLYLIQNDISNVIERTSIENDKIEFLNTLSNIIEIENKKHKETCNYENCFIEYKYETALFYINQEKDKMGKEQKKHINTYIENITITGNGQILNFGNISDKIHNNTSTLESQGNDKISKALEKLTNAIIKDDTIGNEEKQMVLENLELLSEEATKHKENRLSKNVFKNIFAGLNTLSSISTIAGVDFKQVVDYFIS